MSEFIKDNLALRVCIFFIATGVVESWKTDQEASTNHWEFFNLDLLLGIWVWSNRVSLRQEPKTSIKRGSEGHIIGDICNVS